MLDPAPEPEAGSSKDPSKSCLATWGMPADGSDGEEKQAVDESFFITMTSDVSEDKKSNHVPASFFEREAWVDLTAEGLCELPQATGFSISYHSVSKQWHARWWDKHYAPTWGAMRSESMALLLALKQLWTWYKSSEPIDAGSKATKVLKRLDARINSEQ